MANRGELKNLISQYLVLYSGSLNEYANDQLAPSAARIAVRFRTHNTSAVERVIQDIHRWAALNLPEGYTVETSGIAEMEVALTSMITSSQISSLLLSIISVFVILAISFRSPMAALIGSIPLSLAILGVSVSAFAIDGRQVMQKTPTTSRNRRFPTPWSRWT